MQAAGVGTFVFFPDSMDMLPCDWFAYYYEPRDLATIVHKAIDRDPARRYATAADLTLDLQRFLDDKPIKARRISGLERLARWSRRHPGVATSLAVIGLLVMTGVAGLGIAVARFREQAQAQTALAAARDEETAKALEARVQAETARRKLALALTDMHTSQGVAAGQRDEPAQAVLWFANAVRLARENPERERLNRIGARTWARGAFTPIHGFRRTGGYGLSSNSLSIPAAVTCWYRMVPRQKDPISQVNSASGTLNTSSHCLCRTRPPRPVAQPGVPTAGNW
jgi:hypothetical protein